MPQIRGDEEVQPVVEGQDIPSLNAEAGDAMANTGGSAVSSGAPGDAKRRALEASAAAGSDSIRQPASLQVSELDGTFTNSLSLLLLLSCPQAVFLCFEALVLMVCALTLHKAARSNRRFRCRCT